MKNYKQTIKGIKIGFPLILLLLGNGCGDMSGTTENDTGGDVGQNGVTHQEISVGSSYWVGKFSDENPAGFCDEGYLITGVQCFGRYCDELKILCTYVGQKSYINETLSAFSEEHNDGLVNGFYAYPPVNNWAICPYTFVTQIKCTGDYCDNLTLSCSRVNNMSRNYKDCYWTGSFSEEQPAKYLKPGYYLAGIECTGKYCLTVGRASCRRRTATEMEFRTTLRIIFYKSTALT
jgi:hypothetical protein